MYMLPSKIATIVLLLISAVSIAQETKKPELDDAVKRCVPKLVSRLAIPKTLKLTFKQGEKPTGHTPLIAFDILESGDVANARVEGSSGFVSVDEYALRGVRGMKYNSRPGCGTVESKATVLIHWQ